MHLLKHPFGRELLIVAVHLPSKLYQTDDDQAFYARRLSEEISEQEKEIGHNRTMVIGDFNMDPFETGMILADGLHARLLPLVPAPPVVVAGPAGIG